MLTLGRTLVRVLPSRMRDDRRDRRRAILSVSMLPDRHRQPTLARHQAGDPNRIRLGSLPRSHTAGTHMPKRGGLKSSATDDDSSCPTTRVPHRGYPVVYVRTHPHHTMTPSQAALAAARLVNTEHAGERGNQYVCQSRNFDFASLTLQKASDLFSVDRATVAYARALLKSGRADLIKQGTPLPGDPRQSYPTACCEGPAPRCAPSHATGRERRTREPAPRVSGRMRPDAIAPRQSYPVAYRWGPAVLVSCPPVYLWTHTPELPTHM